MLPQGIGQFSKNQGRHLIVLNLKVVGENEAGHNIQCNEATLAIWETDNERLHQPCRDRRPRFVDQR